MCALCVYLGCAAVYNFFSSTIWDTADDTTDKINFAFYFAIKSRPKRKKINELFLKFNSIVTVNNIYRYIFNMHSTPNPSHTAYSIVEQNKYIYTDSLSLSLSLFLSLAPTHSPICLSAYPLLYIFFWCRNLSVWITGLVHIISLCQSAYVRTAVASYLINKMRWSFLIKCMKKKHHKKAPVYRCRRRRHSIKLQLPISVCLSVNRWQNVLVCIRMDNSSHLFNIAWNLFVQLWWSANFS